MLFQILKCCCNVEQDKLLINNFYTALTGFIIGGSVCGLADILRILGYEPADLTVHHPPQNDRGWVHFFRIGV